MVRAEMTVTKNHVRISQGEVETMDSSILPCGLLVKPARVWPVSHANSMSVRGYAPNGSRCG